jgi:hypothetical protein
MTKFECYKCGKLVDLKLAVVYQGRNLFGSTIDWEFYHPSCYEKSKAEKIKEKKP